MTYKTPEEQHAYDQMRYQRDKEKIKKRVREYHHKNRETILPKLREYQKQHHAERNSYTRDWRRNDRTEESRQKEYVGHRRYREANRARITERTLRNRMASAENKLKYIAQQAVRVALKVKYLIRPDCCSLCGKPCKPHGHHADYSKILEVVWLCPMCHRRLHVDSNYSPEPYSPTLATQPRLPEL